MNVQATQAYTETSVETQNQGKLVVMLYEGAIKFLNIAKRELGNEDYASKGVYIGKAQDILSELDTSLDMEAGGDLAENLRALYNFMHRHLTEANIDRDPEKIQECIDILEELHGAWDQATKETVRARADEFSTSSSNGFGV